MVCFLDLEFAPGAGEEVEVELSDAGEEEAGASGLETHGEFDVDSEEEPAEAAADETEGAVEFEIGAADDEEEVAENDEVEALELAVDDVNEDEVVVEVGASLESAVEEAPQETPEEEASVEFEAPQPEDVPAEPMAAEAEPAPEQQDDDDSFDLAAELRDSLEDEEQAEDDAEEADEPTSEEEGFASIFKDFKSGVEKTLGDDDFDTRFDLGIAYRGMELYEDALGEFRVCLESPSHRLESLHMMGLCAIDLGRYGDAANHLEQALASEDVPEPKRAGLRFDLARAFEGAEDFERAKGSFEAARESDASIPSIDECIERVAAQLTREAPLEIADASHAEAEGGFENFDDLVAEVEAEDQASRAESFESFDDVVAEVQAEAAVVEAESPAGDDEGNLPSSDAEPNPSGSPACDEADGDKPKKRKKKRISFV